MATADVTCELLAVSEPRVVAMAAGRLRDSCGGHDCWPSQSLMWWPWLLAVSEPRVVAMAAGRLSASCGGHGQRGPERVSCSCVAIASVCRNTQRETI